MHLQYYPVASTVGIAGIKILSHVAAECLILYLHISFPLYISSVVRLESIKLLVGAAELSPPPFSTQDDGDDGENGDDGEDGEDRRRSKRDRIRPGPWRTWRIFSIEQR